MKIHLRQIPAEGLHVEGEENCLLQELETEHVHCTGPLRYSLDVGLSEGALWANGSLVQPVDLRCVSCLERFPYEITVPSFAVHQELHGPETVDLTPAMREDILLNLPPHPHCDRDGDRLCPGPTVPAASAGTAEEQEAKRERDWEALTKLKLNR